MGGCFSKKSPLTRSSRKKNKLRSSKKVPGLVDRGAPPALPPSPPEEEAVVKEVLTETPNPCAVAALSTSRKAEDAKVVKPPQKVGASTPPASANGCRYGLDGRPKGEEEETSAICCSASESFSVSTTVTEKRDVGAEDLEEETSALRKRPSTKRRPPERPTYAGKGQQQRKRSSSSGEFPSRRRDPKGGRSSPSPAKRPLDGRSFPGRDAARQRAGSGNAAAAGAARTDRGCERCRTRERSASPAAKRAAAGGGGGRGGGGRGVNRSSPMKRMAGPGRASPERTPRREEEDYKQLMVMVGAGAEGGEEGEGWMPPAPGSEETLENPLVSLECFIFL